MKQRSKILLIGIVLLFSMSLFSLFGCEKAGPLDNGSSRESTDDVINPETPPSSHVHSFDANDKCEECGESYQDSGLVFVETRNGEGETIYSVKSYTGNSPLVVIPSKYRGFPVERISASAFEGCETLTDLVIPESVNVISSNAFGGCSNLKSISLPNSLQNIGNAAFAGCEKLLQKENGVYYVDRWVVDCDESVTDLSLRSNVVGIANSAFNRCAKITHVTLPEGIRFICSGAFINCAGLKDITIPKTVYRIESSVFAECINLERVYYGGSESSWKAVDATGAVPESVSIVFNHNP